MLGVLRLAHYPWPMVSRVSAAIFGGYVLAAVISIALALLLTMVGMNRAEAVLAVTMASFFIYAAIIMAVFYARTATRAWLGLAIAGLPPGLFSAVTERAIPWSSLFMP